MTSGDVARRLHCTTQRVRQLDHELHPTLTSGGWRMYRLADVERVAATRAAVAARKAAELDREDDRFAVAAAQQSFAAARSRGKGSK
jgi:hypothetical protein